MAYAFGIPIAALMFVECSTGVLQVRSRFKQPKLCSNSVFGMLYCYSIAIENEI